MAFEPQTYDLGPTGRRYRSAAATTDPLAASETVKPPNAAPTAPMAPAAPAAAQGGFLDPIGIPNDIIAERAIRDGWGSGVPRQLSPARMEARAARVAAAEEKSAQAKAMAVARSIARTDPQSWRDRVDKFNRGVGGTGGLAISIEDVLGQARRPSGSPPAGGMGVYGAAPQIVGEQRGRVGRNAAGAGFREQQIGGRRMGVPLVKVGTMSVPDPNMPEADFNRAYTQDDAAATSLALYKSGFGEFANRQRRIDAGRAALLDDTLSPEQKARAEVELNGQENRLHREFIRSIGRRVTMEQNAADSRMRDMDAPDPEDLADLVQAGVDRGMSVGDAQDYARRRASGDLGAVLPPKQTAERANPRARFNAPRFFETFNEAWDRSIKNDPQLGREWNDVRSGPSAADAQNPAVAKLRQERSDRVRAARSKVFAQTLAESGAGSDITAMRDSFNEGLTQIGEAYKTRAEDMPNARVDVRNLVYSHLPAFADQLGEDPEASIDNLVEQIVRDRVVPLAMDQ